MLKHQNTFDCETHWTLLVSWGGGGGWGGWEGGVTNLVLYPQSTLTVISGDMGSGVLVVELGKGGHVLTKTKHSKSPSEHCNTFSWCFGFCKRLKVKPLLPSGVFAVLLKQSLCLTSP